MKEIDFLPQWYKDNRRRQSRVRRQYGALVVVFVAMMAFNLTATHRAGKAAARVASLENQRVGAEAVLHEFDTLMKRLNALKIRANLLEQMESRVEVAPLLAELSHIIGESIVLRRVEMLAERFGSTEEPAKGAALRFSGKTGPAEKQAPLGQVKFRIVLAGVAAHPADVADLVLRLDGSSYFRQVHLSFYGNTKVQGAGKPAPAVRAEADAAKMRSAAGATEFEIVCYLANYKDMQP